MYDVVIIGGGVNGCGIARDAAGRGLSVFLAEKNDLASGTSSASTKLIHGGLRYLEHYEFRLVRESLLEREVLLAMAPHLIRPLRFVLPHHRGLRPAFLIRLGLFLYDHLGGREALPASRAVKLRHDEAGKPLKPEFTHGFEYSDCWVDDARLVILNAVDAAGRGADIRTRIEMISAERDGENWRVDLLDTVSGRSEQVQARSLVNAAGPWVAEIISNRIRSRARSSIRLVKGSHIVVPQLFDHERAYIFQNADKRIIFAIPFESDFTLIGTTDVDYEGDPAAAEISADEITYLCSAASEYFSSPIRPSDVIWRYSGVRPLFDDGGVSAQEATRDFNLEVNGGDGEPVLLNVFGGKITTYRYLADIALQKLANHIPGIGASWTAGATLPGGDFPIDSMDALIDDLKSAFPFLDESVLRRLARAYGTLAHDILAHVKMREDLGIHFGAGLYQCEVEHLIRHEWAMTADDILWRRTKLGLRFDDEDEDRLTAWLHTNLSAVAASAARSHV